MKSRKKNSSHKSSHKKPYRSPTLTIHGDLRRLTQAKGGAKNDAGMKPATRTASSGAA